MDFLEEEVPLPREGHVPLFRGKFLAFLKKASEKKEVQSVGEDLPSLVKGLYAKEWVVYSKPPFNGPQTVIGYLGRYTQRTRDHEPSHRRRGERQGLLVVERLCRRRHNAVRELCLQIPEEYLLSCLHGCRVDDHPLAPHAEFPRPLGILEGPRRYPCPRPHAAVLYECSCRLPPLRMCRVMPSPPSLIIQENGSRFFLSLHGYRYDFTA